MKFPLPRGEGQGEGAPLALLLLALISTPALAQEWLGPPPKLPATRIITLAPSITETVLALDAKSSLIGVSKFCEFPEVAALPRAGGFNDPSVETIVGLKPQVVIVQKGPSNQKPVETLARLGVSVLALPLTSVDDVSLAMTELGRVTGRSERALALVNELATARATARAEATKTPKRVLFVYGWAPLVVAGPGSFADQLVSDCGAKNAAEKAPSAYPTYSLETVVKLVPDVIIDAADVKDGKDAIEKLGPLKRSKWSMVPTKDLLHPGPALAKALPSLCALVK
ncbi:MAG: ABC transporter substrate-binding protein [Archangium sp.]|nr:ABC transporter substrate-binding protein [Archangium sp.]